MCSKHSIKAIDSKSERRSWSNICSPKDIHGSRKRGSRRRGCSRSNRAEIQYRTNIYLEDVVVIFLLKEIVYLSLLFCSDARFDLSYFLYRYLFLANECYYA